MPAGPRKGQRHIFLCSDGQQGLRPVLASLPEPTILQLAVEFLDQGLWVQPLLAADAGCS